MDKKYEDALIYFGEAVGPPTDSIKAALECMKFI